MKDISELLLTTIEKEQCTAFITVPRGCCFNVAVENVSFGATATDAPTAINVQNANLVVQRVA